MAGFGPAAWAQRHAVSTSDLAAVPEGVDLADAAAMPAAGVTAVQAVRALGPLLGRRVLVTGAAGGAGRLAVQLAVRAGAEVVAGVGSVRRGEGLHRLGAVEVVVTDDPAAFDSIAPVAGVLDLVGDDIVARAFALLQPGGRLLSIGSAAGRVSAVDHEAERLRGGDRWIGIDTVSAPFGPDLAMLLDLMARGTLDPQVGMRRPWTEVAETERALLDRELAGKAVLVVS